MITLICLIVWGKTPDKVLGLGRFLGLVVLEIVIMCLVLR